VIVFVFCVFNPLHQAYILLVILSDSSEFEYHDNLVCHLKYKSTTVSLWCVAISLQRPQGTDEEVTLGVLSTSIFLGRPTNLCPRPW